MKTRSGRPSPLPKRQRNTRRPPSPVARSLLPRRRKTLRRRALTNRRQRKSLRPRLRNMRLADAELRAAAALAGVPAAKLPYVVRMADRSELSGDDLSAAAAKAVAAVLAAVPELGGAAAPVGSMGDHRRVGVGETPEDKVRAEFARNL